MGHDEVPSPLEASVRRLDARARFTRGALVATLLARVWDVLMRGWSVSLIRSYQAAEHDAREALMPQLAQADRLVTLGAFAIGALYLVTAVAFLLWVHSLVALARSLGGEALRWTPAQAVLGFLIPLLNWFRPYQVLRDVHETLALALAPEPSPFPHAGGAARAAPATTAFRVLLGAWWGAFLLSNVVASAASAARDSQRVEGILAQYHTAALASVIAIVAAALALRVIAGLSARLRERARRGFSTSRPR